MTQERSAGLVSCQLHEADNELPDIHQEARLRNPDVEEAWRKYTAAFASWASIIDATTYSALSGFASAEDARLIALKQKYKIRDQALFDYFEVYDADQAEAFGGK